MDWKKLKKFKNHYHLARQASRDMSQSNISFKLNYDEKNGMSTNLGHPPEPEIARFATVLRPLADPDSELYFKHIVAYLHQYIPDAEKDALDKAIKRIDSGAMRLIVNDSPYSSLDLYLIYSKGEYFAEDKEAVKQLKSIMNHPFMPNFLLHQFYDYSFEVYHLCKYLYSLVRKAESSTEKVDSKVNNKCIYCLTEEGSFTSEEHIFPESLGNDKIILPPGQVCDACNNGILSLLDRELVEHDIIAYLRFMFVPYNPKTGKFNKIRFQNMTMEKTHPRKVLIKEHSHQRKNSKYFEENKIGDEVNINFKTRGRKIFQPQILGRSLFKIALGLLCSQKGPDEVLDKKYDAARDFILGKRDFPNNLMMSNKCYFASSVKSEFIIENPGTAFTINIFGAFFFFNIEPEPLIQMNDQLKELGMQCLSLSDKSTDDSSSGQKIEMSYKAD